MSTYYCPKHIRKYPPFSLSFSIIKFGEKKTRNNMKLHTKGIYGLIFFFFLVTQNCVVGGLYVYVCTLYMVCLQGLGDGDEYIEFEKITFFFFILAITL